MGCEVSARKDQPCPSRCGQHGEGLTQESDSWFREIVNVSKPNERSNNSPDDLVSIPSVEEVDLHKDRIHTSIQDSK